MLHIYMISSGHQTSAGCFHLPDAYAAADLDWKVERLVITRNALVECELLIHDPQTDEYFIPRWFKHNPPTNPKHRIGVERLIAKIDSKQIRAAAQAELESLEDSKPVDSGIVNFNSRIANTPIGKPRRL